MNNKITLSVKDRLILKFLLPQEGGLIEMMVVKGINNLSILLQKKLQNLILGIYRVAA